MEYIVWILMLFFGLGMFSNIFLGDFGSDEYGEEEADDDESFLDIF